MIGGPVQCGRTELPWAHAIADHDVPHSRWGGPTPATRAGGCPCGTAWSCRDRPAGSLHRSCTRLVITSGMIGSPVQCGRTELPCAHAIADHDVPHRDLGSSGAGTGCVRLVCRGRRASGRTPVVRGTPCRRPVPPTFWVRDRRPAGAAPRNRCGSWRDRLAGRSNRQRARTGSALEPAAHPIAGAPDRRRTRPPASQPPTQLTGSACERQHSRRRSSVAQSATGALAASALDWRSSAARSAVRCTAGGSSCRGGTRFMIKKALRGYRPMERRISSRRSLAFCSRSANFSSTSRPASVSPVSSCQPAAVAARLSILSRT